MKINENPLSVWSIQGVLLCCCSLHSAKRSSVRSFGCPEHGPGIARGLGNRAATIPEQSWSIPSHFHAIFLLVFYWFFTKFLLVLYWFCTGFFLYNSSIKNIHQKNTKLYIVSYFFNVDFGHFFWQDSGSRHMLMPAFCSVCHFFECGLSWP